MDRVDDAVSAQASNGCSASSASADGSLDSQMVGGAISWLLRARALVSGPRDRTGGDAARGALTQPPRYLVTGITAGGSPAQARREKEMTWRSRTTAALTVLR